MIFVSIALKKTLLPLPPLEPPPATVIGRTVLEAKKKKKKKKMQGKNEEKMKKTTKKKERASKLEILLSSMLAADDDKSSSSGAKTTERGPKWVLGSKDGKPLFLNLTSGASSTSIPEGVDPLTIATWGSAAASLARASLPSSAPSSCSDLEEERGLCELRTKEDVLREVRRSSCEVQDCKTGCLLS